jgi:hypothetical protein
MEAVYENRPLLNFCRHSRESGNPVKAASVFDLRLIGYWVPAFAGTTAETVERVILMVRSR